jgi:hypothetical protein
MTRTSMANLLLVKFGTQWINIREKDGKTNHYT